MNELRRAVNDTLINSLSPSLKASIDRLLARGLNKAGVMEFVKASAGRAADGDANKGKLVVLAVEAYLATK